LSFRRVDAIQLAIREGLLDETDLPRAREEQRDRGGSLARACVNMGYLDDRALAGALARALGLPRCDLRQVDIDPKAFELISLPVLESLTTVPFQLRQDGKVLVVAMADPQDEPALMRLRELSGIQLKVTVAGYREIEAVLAERARKNGPTDPELMAQAVREPTHPGEMIFDLAAIQRDAAAMEAAQAAPEKSQGDQLKAIEKTMKQSSKALRAALDLCVERNLLTLDEIATAMKRSKE
jgi:hypothetical protein